MSLRDEGIVSPALPLPHNSGPPNTSRARSAEIAIVDRRLCDECGLCLPLCPPMAISLRRDGLSVNAATCTGCRKCIAPCPVGALLMVERTA